MQGPGGREGRPGVSLPGHPQSFGCCGEFVYNLQEMTPGLHILCVHLCAQGSYSFSTLQTEHATPAAHYSSRIRIIPPNTEQREKSWQTGRNICNTIHAICCLVWQTRIQIHRCRNPQRHRHNYEGAKVAVAIATHGTCPSLLLLSPCSSTCLFSSGPGIRSSFQREGLFFWVFFVWGGVFFFFAFPWFFLGKTAVSLRYGRIWRDFPWFSYEKTYFGRIWRDFPWFSYGKTYSCP